MRCVSAIFRSALPSRTSRSRVSSTRSSGSRCRAATKPTWLVIQNETATIGLFQGMFEKNIMTFNPGWDRTKKTLPDFDDVRDIQKTLKTRGFTLTSEADKTTTGPTSLTLSIRMET